MYKRDLMRMPIGTKNIELFDGIYSYILEKVATEFGFMCVISVKNSYIGDSVSIFYRYPSKKHETDPWDDTEDYRKINNDWSILCGAGGIRVHSKDVFNGLYDLHPVKRGSFHELCKIELKEVMK